jgi:hypothetical protein
VETPACPDDTYVLGEKWVKTVTALYMLRPWGKELKYTVMPMLRYQSTTLSISLLFSYFEAAEFIDTSVYPPWTAYDADRTSTTMSQPPLMSRDKQTDALQLPRLRRRARS